MPTPGTIKSSDLSASVLYALSVAPFYRGDVLDVSYGQVPVATQILLLELFPLSLAIWVFSPFYGDTTHVRIYPTFKQASPFLTPYPFCISFYSKTLPKIVHACCLYFSLFFFSLPSCLNTSIKILSSPWQDNSFYQGVTNEPSSFFVLCESQQCSPVAHCLPEIVSSLGFRNALFSLISLQLY